MAHQLYKIFFAFLPASSLNDASNIPIINSRHLKNGFEYMLPVLNIYCTNGAYSRMAPQMMNNTDLALTDAILISS